MAEVGEAGELVADCSRCFGLCCVVPAFARSADFAIDKPAGTPCPNLGEGFGCRIHAELRPRGFAGCTAYDCFGAGQRVSQVTFGGVDWRTAPETARQMYAAFPVVRELHELRHHLGEARRLVPGTALGREAELLEAEVEAAAGGAPDELAGVDVASVGGRTGELLGRVSASVRSSGGQDLARADFVGADLRARDLRSATLRGALLLGADLRGSRLHGADLSGALFLTRPQVGAALGDGSTVLPPDLPPPPHWAA